MPGIVAAADPDVHPGHRRLRHARPPRRRADDDDRQDHPDPVPRRTRLAGRGRPRLPADGGHDRRVAGGHPHAPARGPRLTMHRERNPLLSGYALLVYVFLFLPIVILIVFSFNDSEDNFAWTGFTLDWYPILFANEDMLEALVNDAAGRARRGGRRDRPRDPARPRPGPAPEPDRRRPGRDAHPPADGRARDHPRHQPAAVLRPGLLGPRLARPDLDRPHHVLRVVRRGRRPRSGGQPRPAHRGGRARPRRLGIRLPSAT